MNVRWKALILCAFVWCTACLNLTDLAPPVIVTNLAGLPLYDTTLTLGQLLPADTTFLRKDAQTGNLVFVQERTIPPGRIGDSLRISTVPIQATFEFGNRPEIAQLLESLADVFVPISDLLPPLPRSTTTTVPFPGTPDGGIRILSQVRLTRDIESLTLRSGRLRLSIRNHLPFAVELRPPTGASQPGIRFIPRTNGTPQFIPLDATASRTVRPGDSVVFVQSLDNVMIAEGASIETQVFAASSRGITYGDTAGVKIGATLEQPVIAEARISLPSRRFSFAYAVPLAGGVKLSAARIQSFGADLAINNGFEITGIATVTVPQLRTEAGLPFRQSLRIGQGMNRIRLESRTPLDLQPDSLDRLRNNVIDSLRLVVEIQNDSVPFPARITVRSTDKLSLGGALNETQLEFARGTSLPSTTFNLSADVAFTLAPELEKLGFTEVQAEKLDVELRLVNSAGADGRVSGIASIFGRSPRAMDSLVLQNQEVKRAVEQNGMLISVTTVFQAGRENIRLTEIPRRVNVTARGELLQNRPFFIQRASTISGTALLSIPLAVRISGGRYTDTVPFDFRSQIEAAQKNVENASLFLQTLNRIPAQVQVVMRFLDETGKVVLTKPDDGQSLQLRAANGDTATPDEQTISLSSDNLTALKAARKLALEVRFSTPSNAQTPLQTVRFRTSDFVRLRASLNLRVKTP